MKAPHHSLSVTIFLRLVQFGYLLLAIWLISLTYSPLFQRFPEIVRNIWLGVFSICTLGSVIGYLQPFSEELRIDTHNDLLRLKKLPGVLFKKVGGGS